MRHNASYWYSKSCQHYFSGRKKVNRNELVEFYFSGNHTLREVAEKYGVSVSSVQRYIKQTSSKVIILADSASTSIVVQMDKESFPQYRLSVLPISSTLANKALADKQTTLACGRRTQDVDPATYKD